MSVRQRSGPYRAARPKRQRRLFGLFGRVMNGLTTLRNVFARTCNGVAAREESGTGDKKQSDESRHVVLLQQIFGERIRWRVGTCAGALSTYPSGADVRTSPIVGGALANYASNPGHVAIQPERSHECMFHPGSCRALALRRTAETGCGLNSWRTAGAVTGRVRPEEDNRSRRRPDLQTSAMHVTEDLGKRRYAHEEPRLLSAFFALPQNWAARWVGPIWTVTKRAAASSAASVSLLRDCCATDLLPSHYSSGIGARQKARVEKQYALISARRREACSPICP